MAFVRVNPNAPIQVAINQFKKAVEKDQILKDLRRFEYYIKPSIAKKMKSIQARKNAKKKQRPDHGDR
jgi:small subunit ribosomal protein S21